MNRKVRYRVLSGALVVGLGIATIQLVSCASLEDRSYSSAEDRDASAAKRCFKCRGNGRYHAYRGLDPSYPNCGVHWKRCEGCNGSGTIPDNAKQCPRCNAVGEHHDYSGLDPSYPACSHWRTCRTCNKKGWIT